MDECASLGQNNLYHVLKVFVGMTWMKHHFGFCWKVSFSFTHSQLLIYINVPDNIEGHIAGVNVMYTANTTQSGLSVKWKPGPVCFPYSCLTFFLQFMNFLEKQYLGIEGTGYDSYPTLASLYAG